MRAVTDDEVSTGVDHATGKHHDVAPRFAIIFFFSKRQVHRIHTFGAAMKCDHDDVMRCGIFCDGCLSQLVVEQHVGLFGDGVRQHGDLQAVFLKARKITLAARMMDANRVEREHCRCAALLAKVARMVVGEAQDIESGVAIVTAYRVGERNR